MPIERVWLTKFAEAGFIDTFRLFHAQKKDSYTWWDMKTRARDRNVGWRIDYFFADKKIVSKIKNTDILSVYYGSDHCPIWMEM